MSGISGGGSRSRRSVAALLRRLFSAKAALPVPAQVAALLQTAPVQVVQLPGQGRGLIASRALQLGERLFSEPPFLCAPTAAKRQRGVCWHCLAVLPGGATQQDQQQQQQPVFTRAHAFCSAACLAAARAAYYDLEASADLSALTQHCDAHGERFPLLAARLAMMVAQRAMLAPPAEQQQQQQQQGGAQQAAAGRPIGRFSSISRSSVTSSGSSSRAGGGLGTTSFLSSGGSSSRAGGIGRLSAASSAGDAALDAAGAGDDPSAALSLLCFANVPLPPPAPWQAAHKLLLQGLRAAAAAREEPGEGAALDAALDQLDATWFAAVMARLHINAFRVDGVSLDWGAPGGLDAAALGAAAGDATSGSALYLLASLFNHECCPSVNVTFPRNDGTAVFTAARDVAAGEQLTIAYLDTEQPVDVRQEFLAFSYGFACRCAKCVEELEDAARRAPPQL